MDSYNSFFTVQPSESTVSPVVDLINFSSVPPTSTNSSFMDTLFPAGRTNQIDNFTATLLINGTVNNSINSDNLVRRGLPVSLMYRVLLVLDNTVMPAALTVGIIGNSILVMVFLCTPLKASALSHYLTALGVSDLIYLICCLLVWISGRGIHLSNTVGVCQITMFSLRLFRFLATWYLLAAHIERLIVHFGSEHLRKWCQTFRTKCIIIIMFVFSMVGFLHYSWIHMVVEHNGSSKCSIMEESVKYLVHLGKVEVVLALFLPMLVIVIIDSILIANAMNGLRRHCIHRRKTSKSQHTETVNTAWQGEYTLANTCNNDSPSNTSGVSPSPPVHLDLTRDTCHATTVVVLAGILFFGLTLPSTIYQSKNFFSKLAMPTMEDRLNMILFEEIVKFNSVYKIFLYVVFLKSFREGILYVLKKKFKKKRSEEPLEETSV